MTVKDFLSSLGGIVSVANTLHAPVSTVSGWGLNNRIPKWREAALREIARDKGVEFPERFESEAA